MLNYCQHFFTELLNYFPTHDIIRTQKRGVVMIQLYKNIKARRIELKMTQSELAQKLGYADKSMIAKIEKGSVDLTQSKIVAFAKALETTPADLMGWDDSNSTDYAVPKNSSSFTSEEDIIIKAYRSFSSETKKRLEHYVAALLELSTLDRDAMVTPIDNSKFDQVTFALGESENNEAHK